MGCTLWAALEVLPKDARVVVSELTPVMESWCRGPLKEVNGDALSDPRVQVVIADVSQTIARHAEENDAPRFDAIILDLYEGPHPKTHPYRDPFYGKAAIDATRRALNPGGIFSIWSEAPDEGFSKRVKSIGFTLEMHRIGKGGRRHAVYVARRKR
jgi:spermidine synthase